MTMTIRSVMLLTLLPLAGTGDAMHNYVRNLTVDVGQGNPGAVGLRFMTNNSGAMYDVTIRDLRSRNRVPAIVTEQHSIIMTDAELTGGDPQSTAIVNNYDDMYLRNVKQQGYGHLLQKKDKSYVDGPTLDEFYEGKSYSLFGNKVASLRLPVEETPEVPWEADCSKWEIIDWTADDDTEAVQQAFDNAAAQGKTTVCFPKPKAKTGKDYPWGWYRLAGPIRVHGSVNRIIGMENEVVFAPAFEASDGTSLFVIEDLTSDAIVIERFFCLGKQRGYPHIYAAENQTDRLLIIKNMGLKGHVRKPGKPGS